MVEAENGRVALERLRDVLARASILLDLMMPEMDGFEFVAELRRHEAWRAIPIVVITAKDLTPTTGSGSTATWRGSSRKAPTAARSCWPRCASWCRPAWRGEAAGLMAKILLVEDNEMNRDMLSRRLARRGERSQH